MSSTVTLKVESVVCRMLRVYDSPRLCHSLTRAVSAHVPKCGKEILREWVDATTYPVACPLPSQAENPLPRDLGCCTQQVLVSIHVYVLLMLMLYVIQIDHRPTRTSRRSHLQRWAASNSMHSLLVQRSAMRVPHLIPARLAKQRESPAMNHRRTVFARDHATPAAEAVQELGRGYTLAHSINFPVPLRAQHCGHSAGYSATDTTGLSRSTVWDGLSPCSEARGLGLTHPYPPIASQIYGVWPLRSFRQ